MRTHLIAIMLGMTVTPGSWADDNRAKEAGSRPPNIVADDLGIRDIGAYGGGWKQSFKAGMIDESTGKPVRGTAIMRLVAHKGRLYAGNGYWMDTRLLNIPWSQMDKRLPNLPWSQVLVLDARDGTWKVNLSLGVSPL